LLATAAPLGEKPVIIDFVDEFQEVGRKMLDGTDAEVAEEL